MSKACPFATRMAFLSIIPLFAERPSHPFVPLNTPSATAQSRSQGWPLAGACALPLRAASPVASWRRKRHRACHRIAFFCLLSLSAILLFPGFAKDGVAAAQSPLGDTSYATSIVKAAQKFNLPAAWIEAIIRIESGGHPHAISPMGAMGLMQLMPATWRELRLRYGLGSDPFDPQDNVSAGTAYLRTMLDRYGSPGFLAAYHAGPGRYEAYRDRHRPLPPETLAYIGELQPLLSNGRTNPIMVAATVNSPNWAKAPLFIPHVTSAKTTGSAPSPSPLQNRLAAAGMQNASTLQPHAQGLFVVILPQGQQP